MSQLTNKLNQVEALLNQGKAQQGFAILQTLMPKYPRDLGVLSLSALACQLMGKLEQGEFFCKQALLQVPNNADLLTNLGILQINQIGNLKVKREEAMGNFRKALALEPHNHNARVGVANLLMEAMRPSEALAECEAGLVHGLHDQLALTHGKALIELGRPDDAIVLLERAIGAYPDNPQLRLSSCVARIATTRSDPALVARAHRDFGRAFVAPLARLPVATKLPGPADAERRLRVGILSPDLRRHSVAFFSEPWMRHLDTSQFELFVYHSNLNEDDYTARLKEPVSSWTSTPFMSEIDLAQRMQQDRIDIAIELAGLTSGNRLGALAMRAAPVTVTYCGYPDTTGIPGVDYRIVDAVTDPPAAETPGLSPNFDERCSERLVRLAPCFLCYNPAPGAPTLTRSARGHVQFGSFNAARKLNQTTVDLWAKVLAAVPGSRVVIKSIDLNDATVQANVRRLFERAGVGDRVDLLPASKGIEEHLAQYQHMDIGLDTFPYNGTTTTCEALWMGVPVVTVLGPAHVSRVSASLLRAAGLDELVARDEAEFVAICTRLAGDQDAVATYQRTLRDRLAASALCDQARFGVTFGNALRWMWREACEGRIPSLRQ
jgi:protein O-GlcNAc transferase